MEIKLKVKKIDLCATNRYLFENIKSFLFCRGGNIAVTFALTASTVVVGMGGALDYSRAGILTAKLQSGLDSGVLAAASMSQEAPSSEIIAAFVAAALEDHPSFRETVQIQADINETLNSRTITATATADVETLLLGVTGINTIRVQRSAQAREQIKNIEISLVLDISSSMNSGRLENLRSAAIDFANTMLEGASSTATTLSIIPYGGTVRLPPSFLDFVIDDDTFQHPNFSWELNVPDDINGWNGCLEMHSDQVRSITLEQNSLGIIPGFTVWNQDNGWCPDHPSAETLFISGDLQEVSNHINDLQSNTRSDGTGTDIGVGWGLRALHPEWRGTFSDDPLHLSRPADFDDPDTVKVLIVMTDGGTTAQLRPGNSFTPPDSLLTLTHVGTPGTSLLYHRNEARANFEHLCDEAKMNNVHVYTIAFQVRTGWQKSDMETCATSNSHYFEVENLNIEDAFSSIASNITFLRISQ